MSYSTYTLEPLGGGITTAASAVAAIAKDPCLVRLSDEVLKLQEVMAEKEGTTEGGRPTAPGVGLCYAITPVKLFRQHVKRPWLFPVAIVGVGALLVYAGYAAGKRRR